MKVLVVDDDESIRKFLEVTLKAEGHEAFSAQNGEEAVQLAKSELPDAILLDIRMPEIDGWEVLRRLRKDERTKKIPVIFLTAMPPSQSNLATSHILNADAYITKPIDPEEVSLILKKILKKS
jgi:DNA-binding response OmpR family regulator